jgi:hypothetical protein
MIVSTAEQSGSEEHEHEATGNFTTSLQRYFTVPTVYFAGTLFSEAESKRG